MEVLSNLACKPQQTLRFSLHHRTTHRFHHYHRNNHPSFSQSISFKTPLFSHSLLSVSVRASNSVSPTPANPPNPKPPKTLNFSSSPFAFLKLPLSVAVTVAAVFMSRLSPFRPLPALAEPATVESVAEETPNNTIPDKADQEATEEERALEEHVASHPDDVRALKTLMELKIRNRKIPEVLEIASRLIELQPDEVEWRLLKGHMYCYMSEFELAKPVFEEILSKDPNRVEAYHGLVMSASQLDADGGKELGQVEKRIQGAMERLIKEKKKQEIREFQLLIAQIRVIEGDYMAALKVYQDLVKEEPRDYRPYLCQGIIYTLLRKKEQAEEQFAKYKRLVPKEHPYASYFEDNVKTTSNVFSEMRQK